jgi:site-specific DNA recombinase
MAEQAVLYARVSSDDTRKDGRNLEGQITLCREHAQRQGYEILEEFQENDRGASGADWNLPELNRALDMAQAGKFDVLVVRELDRFARGLAKQLVIEQQFKAAGVTVDYVIGDYPDTPEGRLNKNVKAVIAEYEREQIKARMTRGRRQKVTAGHVMMHARVPFGYTQVKNDGKTTLEIFEPEAEIIRLIFQWYTQGDNGASVSIREIARRLTEMRVMTSGDKKKHIQKRRRCGEWSAGTLYHILTNQTYAGVWYYGKTKHVDKTKVIHNPEEYWLSLPVDPIIDAQTWQATQERLKYNKEQSVRNRKGDYLIAGLVTCGHCGAKIYSGGVAVGKRAYYRCSAARKMIVGKSCDAPNFRVSVVDAAVWGWVKEKLLNKAKLQAGLLDYQAGTLSEVGVLRGRLETVENLAADNRKQLEKLIDLYLSSDDFTKDLLTDRKRRIEEALTALEAERKHLTESVENHTLTDSQIDSLLRFGEQIAMRLDAVEADFAARRSILELLRMRIVLGIEDEKLIVRIYCVVGQDTIHYDNCVQSFSKYVSGMRNS